jgi:hypothetical protein
MGEGEEEKANFKLTRLDPSTITCKKSGVKKLQITLDSCGVSGSVAKEKRTYMGRQLPVHPGCTLF